jgi:hypothetical protein
VPPRKHAPAPNANASALFIFLDERAKDFFGDWELRLWRRRRDPAIRTTVARRPKSMDSI